MPGTMTTIAASFTDKKVIGAEGTPGRYKLKMLFNGGTHWVPYI